jgi:hypothetical protein
VSGYTMSVVRRVRTGALSSYAVASNISNSRLSSFKSFTAPYNVASIGHRALGYGCRSWRYSGRASQCSIPPRAASLSSSTAAAAAAAKMLRIQ